MRSFLFKALLATLLLASSLAQGQTILQDQGASTVSMLGAESALGQSFVATLTGNVTALGVRSMQAVPATLRIYNGAAGSGTPGAIGAPVYTQAGVTLTAAIGGALGPAGGFTNIPLTTPFPVTAGQTYTFMVTAANPFSLAARSLNPYPPGNMFTNYASIPFAGFDLAFQVFEVAPPPPVATPAAVPTLGEWALLVLATLMVLLAAGQMRRRPGL